MHAAGPNPLSIQSGKKEYPFKLTLLKAAVDSVWLAAVAAGGDDITDATFDIQGVFQAQGGRPLTSISVTGCQISEANFKIGREQKSMSVDLPGLAMGILVSGGD